MVTYLVFRGDDYYPGGGWSDFVGKASTIEGARTLFTQDSDGDWAQIVKSDGVSFEEVESWTNKKQWSPTELKMLREWRKDD